MNRTIDVVIYREDDQWVAQALNVEVSSFGDTPDDAPDVADARIERVQIGTK